MVAATSTTMAEEFLVFENVSKRFGEFAAVDEVSFTVNEGEIFSLLGPSGCGKTTLLRMVAGFIQPDTGRILLGGDDLAGTPPERRPVNTVFQNYALFPHLTVEENIAFGLKMARASRIEIDRAVADMLALVDLKEHGRKKPSQISGGQKQRVAIARALVNRPKVLLLDEPLAALDLKLRQRLLVELDDLHDEVGTTFLYVTHDQGEAMGISDRIAVMDSGKVAQIGSPAEVYEAPVSSFVAAFIGDTNFLAGVVTDVVDDEYSSVQVEGIGAVTVFNDRPLTIGQKINVSLRPEKLQIERGEPERTAGRNVLRGAVEDVIYLGSLTRYWVRVGGHLFSVERQHARFLLDEKPPTWKDDVWLSWDSDDGYLLGSFDESDASMLPLASLDGG